MKIEILGTGCQKCEKVLGNVKQAVKDLNKECEIVKVTDIKQIMSFKIMLTPALVIDDKVKVSGRVPSVDEIKKWIEEEKI